MRLVEFVCALLCLFVDSASLPDVGFPLPEPVGKLGDQSTVYPRFANTLLVREAPFWRNSSDVSAGCLTGFVLGLELEQNVTFALFGGNCFGATMELRGF